MDTTPTAAPDLNAIVARIQEEARRRQRAPRADQGPAPSVDRERLGRLHAFLDQAESKAHPPTVWPPDLRRFPFNLAPVRKVALGFYGLLMARTRDSLLPLCRALRESLALAEETQAALAASEAQRKASEALFRNQLWLQARQLAALTEQPPAQAGGVAAGAPAEGGHEHDAFWAAFSEEFRGSWDDVHRRLAVYAPLVEGLLGSEPGAAVRVLDLGCGRGEWLAVAKERGWSAQGVESNAVLAEACRGRGLDVVEADALAHLRAQPADSLEGVTAFHVVEHLPFEALWALLVEALRALRPGGVLILETPNPECVLVTTGDFYKDPTHRQPVHPETLAFLARQLGYAQARTYCLEDGGAERVLQPAERGVASLPARLQVTARDFCLVAAKARL
jgi:SAM-dependent methyltransferase